MILSVTLNPSVDQALFVDQIRLGDTNRVRRVERDAGGKGVNLSRVVAELGGRTAASGFLAGASGEMVRAVLRAQGVQPDFIEVAGETRVNFSVEDDSGNPPTTFNERGPEISKEAFECLVDKCSELAAGARWVAMGGSLPPGAPAEAFLLLGRLAKLAGAKLMLDADGEALRHGVKALPHFMKPNQAEAGRLLGREIESEEDAIQAARELVRFLDPSPESFAVLSRGADGAILATTRGCWVGASPKVESRSTIGSGDSLIGAMLWSLEEGFDLATAFRWGLAAGAATATTDGSEICRKARVEALVRETAVRAL